MGADMGKGRRGWVDREGREKEGEGEEVGRWGKVGRTD